jgi:hypothetical protein
LPKVGYPLYPVKGFSPLLYNTSSANHPPTIRHTLICCVTIRSTLATGSRNRKRLLWLAIVIHDCKLDDISSSFGHPSDILSDISSDILYEKSALYAKIGLLEIILEVMEGSEAV